MNVSVPRSLAALALVAALAVPVAGAASAQPSVAGMTLAAADIPGAKLVSQGKLAAGGYVSAYQRTLKLTSPYGRSEIVGVQSEGKLAANAKQVTTDLSVVQRVLNSPTGRSGFLAGIANKLQVEATAVKLGALRHPHVGDGAVELPLSIQLPTAKAYESLLYMRFDRVFELLVVVGARPIAPADSANLARILQAHIKQQLTPVDLTPPAITGTVAVDQTLTVTPGTWSNADVTLTYQWQRCDGTGANCAAIAGATSATYTIAATDAGSTFEVVETATDRFGAPTATSTATAVVPPPPPVLPQPSPGPPPSP
jgi:hypothetical protein